MVVRSIGNSLLVILPELVGKKITNWFDLVRPLIAFKFQTVSAGVGKGFLFTFRMCHCCCSELKPFLNYYYYYTCLTDFESNEQYFRIGDSGTGARSIGKSQQRHFRL